MSVCVCLCACLCVRVCVPMCVCLVRCGHGPEEGPRTTAKGCPVGIGAKTKTGRESHPAGQRPAHPILFLVFTLCGYKKVDPTTTAPVQSLTGC